MTYYTYKIEFASPDYDEAIRLRYKLLRAPLDLEFDVQDLKEEYLDHHFGIFDSLDALIGTVLLSPLDSQKAKLRQMAIDESHQGKNIGRQLIQDIERWASAEGYETIILHARKSAIGFYEKLAYQVEGSEFKEVGIPHFKMFKSLKAPA